MLDPPQDRQTINALVLLLDSQDEEEAQRAQVGLQIVGRPALPQLEEASRKAAEAGNLDLSVEISLLIERIKGRL
jgi:hypothetical protein